MALESGKPRKAILVCRSGKVVPTALSGEISEQMEYLKAPLPKDFSQKGSWLRGVLGKSQMRKWAEAEPCLLPASLSEAGLNIWGAGPDSRVPGESWSSQN